MIRKVQSAYQDPLELIWLRAAERLGMRVVRSAEVFASWDGAGTLTIATSEHFDADDNLGQMIFHEICHALVAGDARHQPDWGLDNDEAGDIVFEHATHRLQAALAGPYGLRDFMAVTTDWRPYWDALPQDPLTSGDDPAISLAQRAHYRSRAAPWAAVLEDALSATAAIADVVRPHCSSASLWAVTHARHRTGFLLNEDSSRHCGQCAWAYEARGKTLRCRRSKNSDREAVVIDSEESACECWEPRLTAEACGPCGACCREGFDLVQVRPREAFNKLHPELVSTSTLGLHVQRPDGRCKALRGDGESAPYRCAHYADRPRACADFPVAGDACLLARRRVGLSR